MPSSRTPDGYPIECPVCGTFGTALVTQPPGDTVCPACGSHVWVRPVSRARRRFRWLSSRSACRQRIAERRNRDQYASTEAIRWPTRLPFSISAYRETLERIRRPPLLHRLMIWWRNDPDPRLDNWNARACGIVDSMTREEKLNPRIIDARREKRLAYGSGTSQTQVRQFLCAFAAMNNDPQLVRLVESMKRRTRRSIGDLETVGR